MFPDVHFGPLLVGDFDAGRVGFRVKMRLDFQPGLGGGAGNQFQEDVVGAQWSTGPIDADESEQSMLYGIPFRSAGRIVTDRD